VTRAVASQRWTFQFLTLIHAAGGRGRIGRQRCHFAALGRSSS
jgi:hypothetical protein